MKKYLLILCALLLTAIGASAQTITDGTYMLQNVETGYYLGSGCTWGTQASLIKQPQQFTLTETVGTYTLESYVYNGENSNKLGTNLYVDGSDAASWTIEKRSNGAYTLYNATAGYLAGNGKDEPVEGVTSITSATYWNLITKDDIVASQANATSASPVDVTGLINNPSLNKNSQTTYGTAYWSTTGTVNIGYTNAGGDTKSYGNVAEGYHVGFSMYQTLSNLTPGIYVLSAQGFHRDDDSQDSYTAPVMYVGSELSGIPSMTSANGVCTQKGSSGQTMADAQTDFLSNLYPISPIQFTVEDSNTSVEFGFKGTDTHEWVIWGDLELLYYGEELTYAIGEPECALDGKYVQPGSEVSITFPNCVTPSTDEPQLASGKYITVNDKNVTDANLTYSGTTATVTFIVPDDIARGTTVTVIVPQGLVTWADADVSSPAEDATFYLSTPLIEDQLGVYLFNLGENEFLSRGHNYNDENGTAADVDVYGLPVDITANADGKYNIRYIDSNLYLGGMYWATANEALTSAASFTIVEDGTATDGKTIYRFRNGSSSSTVTGDLYVNNGTSHGPLGLNDDNDGIKSTADRQWVIYSKDERDALKEANVLNAKLKAATALDPSFSGTTEDEFNEFIESLNSEVCTDKVNGASLASTEDLASWTEDDYALDGSGFTAGNNTIETYNDVDDLTQTITGLEEGIYKVTLQGYNRMGDAAYILANLADYDISLATLGANDDEINLKTWASDRPTEEVYNNKYASLIATNDSYFNLGYNYFPNSQYQANLIFGDEAYQNELYTYVGDGSLTITIACPDYLGANWVVFTNMTLTRYYTDDIYTNDVTWELANPSFEVDNVVENLTPDANTGGTSRCDDDNDGAWTITSLTGWNLTKNSVSDLMSEKAAATDNNFGAPGTPADGTYMLYLRDAWADATDKVSQSVTLPAGNYKVTVDSKCVSGASGHSVQLTVGDIASANLTISLAMPEAWNTTSVKFYLAEATTLDVAVSVTYGGSSASGLSVLLDNFKLYSAEEIEETISWTMTDAGWGTMILPFSATLDNGLTAYSCSDTEDTTDEEGNEITVVSLTEVGSSIVANTPYIIGGTANTYSFKGVPTPAEDDTYKETYKDGLLTGTLVNLAVAKGAAFTLDGTEYLLQNHDGAGEEGLAFYPIIAESSSEATLDAYHCYLTLDSSTSGGSGVRASISLPGSGEETGIVAVESAEAEGNGAIYDLSGRKVSKAVKGVYIQNGKKVLVK